MNDILFDCFIFAVSGLFICQMNYFLLLARCFFVLKRRMGLELAPITGLAIKGDWHMDVDVAGWLYCSCVELLPVELKERLEVPGLSM
jgi:hypothetical protein